jgi:hypothetical protein
MVETREGKEGVMGCGKAFGAANGLIEALGREWWCQDERDVDIE